MARFLAPVVLIFYFVCSVPAQVARNYHLQDVNWALSFNEEEGSISGDVTNTVTVLEDGTNQIAFNEGKLDIGSVTVNGEAATFNVDADHEQMVIALPKAVDKDTVLKIRIVYTGKPEAGVYFVPADRSEMPVKTNMVYTQGEAEDTRYWLPTYDEPDDKATSESYISVPKGYFAVSNGALIDVKHQGDHDIYHWKIDQPHSTYLTSFVAGKYAEGKERWGDLPVNWYVPAGTEDTGRPTFGGTADMVKFYSELTGVKYPYAKFAQSAVADFAFGGMENISAVTQTIGTLHPPKEAVYADSRSLVLHELAHQWFGDYETCKDWSNIWLNEGFATFLPHFYFRAKDGEDEYQVERLNDMEGALRAMQVHPRQMLENHYEVPMDLFFDGHAYEGGSARLFVLQSVLGEKLFWQGIHQFLTDYALKPATTDDFFRSMSKSTGQDLGWFEKQYFRTAALPAISARLEGKVVTISQRAPFFTLDLDFWELEKGQWKKTVIPLHAETAKITLDDDDDWFLVDPTVKYCATVTCDYNRHFSFREVGLLYKVAPNAAAKKRLVERALDWIGSYPTGKAHSVVPKEAIELLESLFKTEPSSGIKRYIVSRIPTNLTAMLIELSHNSDPMIRMTAVRRLAFGVNTPESLQRLREIWNTGDSDTIKGAALMGILNHAPDAAFAKHVWTMDSFGDQFRASVLEWWSNSSPDAARDAALSVLSGHSSENLRSAAINVLGTVKDKPGEKVVFQALVDRLSDRSLHEKESALFALENYGDKAALPYLHKFDNFSQFMVRREAQGIERRLGAQ